MDHLENEGSSVVVPRAGHFSRRLGIDRDSRESRARRARGGRNGGVRRLIGHIAGKQMIFNGIENSCPLDSIDFGNSPDVEKIK